MFHSRRDNRRTFQQLCSGNRDLKKEHEGLGLCWIWRRISQTSLELEENRQVSPTPSGTLREEGSGKTRRTRGRGGSITQDYPLSYQIITISGHSTGPAHKRSSQLDFLTMYIPFRGVGSVTRPSPELLTTPYHLRHTTLPWLCIASGRSTLSSSYRKTNVLVG